MNHVLESLPILVLYPHNRCNCRCVMCDIWKLADQQEIAPEELERHADSMRQLGVRWVVLSGGEPLMHSDLFQLCAILRRLSIRITLLSSGLLLARFARQIVEHVDDVIVSLDGPQVVHDAIRGVKGAFNLLSAGVQVVRAIRSDFPISARTTVQKLNARHLVATVSSARELGLDSISFLAADVKSDAFNRPSGWNSEHAASVTLTRDEVDLLEAEIEALIAIGECDGFVRESPEKLRRIVRHFRANLGNMETDAPRCNAPWVSAVIETNGLVRPCFFHRPIGRLDSSATLLQVLNSPEAVGFRASLDVASDPTCRRCVCSLNWSQ